MNIIWEEELTAADLVPTEFDVWVHRREPGSSITTISVNRGTYVETFDLEDTTALLAANAADANEFSTNARRGDWVHAARLPKTLAAKMRREEWEEADVKRFLNDADNRAFRVTSNWRV